MKHGKQRLFRIIACVIVCIVLFGIITTASAVDGIYHEPTGWDDLYGGTEVEGNDCERYPRDPIAGETVYLKSKTWPVENGDAVWVTWTKNGVTQPVINAEWKYNSGNDTHWEANIGSFAKGDVITYTLHANQYGTNEQTTGPYTFTVTDWDYVTQVTSVVDYGNRVELTCASTTVAISPKISFSFPGTGYFRMQAEPLGSNSFATGLSNYTVDQSNPNYIWINGPGIKIKITKNPYRMEVYDGNGYLLTQEVSNYRSLAFRGNGTNYINAVEQNLITPSDESFAGFGMRYNTLNQRGNNVDIYTVNWYLNQGDKTYLPIPFYFSNKGYGTYLNTSYYVQYRLATDDSNRATIRANAGGTTNTGFDIYYFAGTPKEISQKYTDVIEKPALPSVWAFGPWISANEWNKQSEVLDQVAKTNQYDIPTTAMVIEAWADEETFYIWGDAQYTPHSATWVPTSTDFSFTGRWPDPAGMVDTLHDNGIKVLLWQLPVIKSASNPIPQLATDEAYAINQGYVLDDGTGSPYRNKGGWYGNAVMPDFTNTAATNWWMSKRAYLLDEIGIDGFKCDGGEFVWGRNITASNGMKGDELRNLYPDLYVQAYSDFVKDYNTDGIVFFRAGGSGAGQHPIAWVGDQTSSFSAYRDAMRATMNASMSGVPFVTWDLAGFSGEIPTTELYKRSVAQAAFSPIMQLHSEWGGDPSPSVARTPWNMYERTGDLDCINIYRKFANYRMSLIPYLYNQAKYTNATGIPMMRSMAYEFPNDTTADNMEFQYMLGDNLLVAPIENEGQTDKLIYLPEGEWIDLFWGAKRPGGSLITYSAGLDAIPVFVKAGSVIPMNLNENYEFGGSVGNSTENYTNFTFRIYPQGTIYYDYYDYVADAQLQLTVQENYNNGTITAQVPGMTSSRSLQIFASEPSQVKIGGSLISRYSDFNSFKTCTTGWYYNTEQHMVIIRAGTSSTTTTVELIGTSEVPYEAEFAAHTNVSVNTNHFGYEGTGFVDGFAEIGDAVGFDVYAPTAGSYTLELRYSAGTEAAKRAVYVNGNRVAAPVLPKTTNWDSWSVVSVIVTLPAGKSTIAIGYDTDCYSGINLDNIKIT